MQPELRAAIERFQQASEWLARTQEAEGKLYEAWTLSLDGPADDVREAARRHEEVRRVRDRAARDLVAARSALCAAALAVKL